MGFRGIALTADLDEDQPAVTRAVQAVRLVGAASAAGDLAVGIAAWRTGSPGWLIAYIVYSVLFFACQAYLNTIVRRKQRNLDREWARRLRELAIRDELTGLYNRRYFNDQLAALIPQCKEQRRPLTVALIDMNGLKTINDTYGHHAGDTALQAVATCIAHSVGEGALAARTGGDEFAVIFPGLHPAEAGMALSAARAMLDATPMTFGQAGETAARVGAAVGLAALEASHDQHQLLRAADAALYANKRELGQLQERRKASGRAAEPTPVASPARPRFRISSGPPVSEGRPAGSSGGLHGPGRGRDGAAEACPCQ